MIATAKMFLATAIPGRPNPPGERSAMPGVPRQVVSPAQLLATVNAELGAREDCEGLEMGAAASLHARFPDADGCNWNAAGLQVRVAHGPSTRALAGVRQVVDWARLHLELAEPGF
ncbi:MAG TPA: hypothetical protein VE871_07380 [Longimicrobium sp.]|nr:hypothetical protein [Longimicrobium sp.]